MNRFPLTGSRELTPERRKLKATKPARLMMRLEKHREEKESEEREAEKGVLIDAETSETEMIEEIEEIETDLVIEIAIETGEIHTHRDPEDSTLTGTGTVIEAEETDLTGVMIETTIVVTEPVEPRWRRAKYLEKLEESVVPGLGPQRRRRETSMLVRMINLLH